MLISLSLDLRLPRGGFRFFFSLLLVPVSKRFNRYKMLYIKMKAFKLCALTLDFSSTIRLISRRPISIFAFVFLQNIHIQYCDLCIIIFQFKTLSRKYHILIMHMKRMDALHNTDWSINLRQTGVCARLSRLCCHSKVNEHMCVRAL